MQKKDITDPISVRAAARILGLSPTRVQQFKTTGELNFTEKGKLSLAEVLALEKKRRPEEVQSDLAQREQEARVKLLEEQAKKAEIDNSIRMGALIAIDDVIDDAAQTASKLNQFLDTLPARLVPRLIGRSEIEMTDILTDELELAKRILFESQFVEAHVSDGAEA